jgi:hypothetical protein
MRTVKISEEVYGEIAKRGKFGETVDDVLRRQFRIAERPEKEGTHLVRTILARRRMSPSVRDGEAGVKLEVDFQGGPSRQFALPSRDETAGFRVVLEEALRWAKEQGATDGQSAYIRKVLHQAGYYLQGPRM